MKVHTFYRRHNLRVHEIPAGVKCPVVVGWPDANPDYDVVESRLGSQFNKYGWLLDDNHVVIDIDLHNAAENGLESLERLEANCGVCLSEKCGAIVYSPSGGRHYYFTKPAGVTFGKVFKSIYPGIDFISGKGKQVIAANSAHDKYPGEYRLEGDELRELPAEVLGHLVSLSEKRTTYALPAEDRSGDEFNQSARGLAFMVSLLQSSGYSVRHVHDYYEFDRPNKSSESRCSGHLGKKSKQGNYQLTCFSLSDPYFPSGEALTLFHAYALFSHSGNHHAAAMALYQMGFAAVDALPLDSFLANYQVQTVLDSPPQDDEDFCETMLPADGLLREVYDFYLTLTRRPSSIIGLATAVAFCESIFGRRVRSYTDLRTHDYTVIVAPTNCGKESVISTIQKLIYGADSNTHFLIPPNVQSGNGLLAAMAQSPACMWMCDEFGTFLEGALDKRQATKHTREIVDHLLQMYGRANATYQGAAHAAGTKNQIEQPSLSLLGITTGSTLFENIDRKQIESGLFGRCSFWPVQTRPKLRKTRISLPAPLLLETIRGWIGFVPGLPGVPSPDLPILKFSKDAEERWDEHEEAIDQRMNEESELRAAVWGRAAARSMKLAMVHRCARLEASPGVINWDFVYVEKRDVDWGICVSNWLARTSCDYATNRVGDFSGGKSVAVLEQILKAAGGEWVARSVILRTARDLTAGDIGAAAKKLDATIETREQKKGRGRPEIQYRWRGE
jgi:hypothetical protein